METWRATHSHARPSPGRVQSKDATTLAPIVIFDAVPASPALGPSDPAILSPRVDLDTSRCSSAQANVSSPTEQSPLNRYQNTSTASVNLLAGSDAASDATRLDPPLLETNSLGSPVQLRMSISIDPEQHYARLVKAKVHVVLVLTALLQLSDRRETWVEQSRTELMSLEKGCLEGHFVKILPLQIHENFLVVGFTLLAVPSPSTSSKVVAAFPGLDGLLPWAETSVAIEHFAVGSNNSNDNSGPRNSSQSHAHLSSFSTPLMEISLLPDTGLRKSKHTVATLNVVVEETLPSIPLPKAIAEQRRLGPSFSQTYHGQTVRGTTVYGREHLYESPVAFSVPLKLLQLFAQDERRVLEELEKEPGVSLSDMIQAVPLDHRPNPITRGASFMETLRRSTTRPTLEAKEQALKSTRARQIGLSEEDSQLQKLLRQQISAHRNMEVYYQDVTSRVEQKLKENMEIGQGPFRRSPEKKEESVQWIPLNCCVQDFLVHDEGHQTNYQSTTVGAAAAHSAGFARWTGTQTLGKMAPLGAYWSKQERGGDLMRDYTALQDVLNSCWSDFTSILASSGGIDKERVLALVKEIRFLNGEIISFGECLFSDYLTALSTEGGARFVCGEIRAIIERLQQVDISVDDMREQGLSSEWLAHHKRSVREIVTCTQDLSNFVAIAIQHECLVADATLVATPDWIMVKKTRECCLSQITAALATSFLALLEDWWTNMATALQDRGTVEQRQQEQHYSECPHSPARDMEFIKEEGSDLPGTRGHSVSDEDQVRDETSSTSRKSLSSVERNGKGTKLRRPSLRSATSNISSVGSSSGDHGTSGHSSRRKSFFRHPLESAPQAKAQNDLFWDQLMSLGWLAQIGSLLSTQGNELGMLLDYAQAATDARESITIGFHALPLSSAGLPTRLRTKLAAPAGAGSQIDLDDLGDNFIQISGRRGQITMSFGLDPLQFSLLPDQLKAGTSKIQVWPVLFSQGINEMQTISNLTGKSPTQRWINEEGLRHMQSYVLRYHAWRAQSQPAQDNNESRPDKTRGRSFSPYSTWRSNADLSSASLMSSLSAEWDIVTPSRAEIWNGESLVVELLNHLEMAVLGHSDDTKSHQEISTTLQVDDAASVQSPLISYSNSESLHNTTREELGPGSTSGIFGTMMEFGTSKLFSFKGSKDTSILECAEALTRALGQIKAPLDTQNSDSESQTTRHHRAQGSELLTVKEPADCKCFPPPSESLPVLPPSSLWVTSHIMSCKSAKDRTSMSVTLSQVNLLRACHGLQTGPEQHGGDDWQAILDAMRSEVGVRIKNVERNLKLGDFAKDLLWLSAFGSPIPHQLPLSVFDSTASNYQESSYVPDALTLVRSLLPGGGQTGMTSLIASGSAVSMVDSEEQPESAGFMEEDVPVEPTTPVEEEASESLSSSLPIISPTLLESPPPPLKLVKSSTGAALDPVVTLDIDLSHGNGTIRGSRLFSQSHDSPSSPTSSSAVHPHDQGRSVEEEHYTSFPGSFDEPQLAARLARSLGLDALGRPFASDASSSGEHSHQQQHAKLQGQASPPQQRVHRTAGMHRSTPSWSSQQSIIFQQQLQQQQQQQQLVPPRSPIAPLFAKRLSSFGQGLGLIPKPKDPTSHTATESSTPPVPPHARHQSQGSVEFGFSSQISSPPCSSNNAAVGNFSGRTACGVAIGSGPASLQDASAAAAVGKRGKFAFNKVQLKFLPAAYRPPRRMATSLLES